MFPRIMTIILFTIFALVSQAQDITDSTGVIQIILQDHPDNPDPNYKPGEPTFSFDSKSTSTGPSSYGAPGDFGTDAQIITDDTDTTPADNLNFVEGFAANPLSSDLDADDYQYSQMEMVHVTIKNSVVTNN